MAKQIENLEKKAAQSTTAVNNMIGIRRGELLKSLGVLVANAARQPGPLAKNIKQYGKELADIVKGTSELAPERRDRRFMDPTWKYNPIYKRGLQSWLAMRQGFEGWIQDSGISEADKARSKFVLDIIIDSFAPTNTLLGNPAGHETFLRNGRNVCG